MQSTTNYSMNLVEGSDLVNIPVQLNPNFQTIDSEMYKNKQSSVGIATEVVTGTVHAVVRANVDADVFRFTATGAWTAGDTMTLDGSAVTVHLADGTTPATGAYIIGAEVVAVVNGTLVTLLTSAAQPVVGVTSFNTRTGAVVPATSDYDASMIDYDNTGSGLAATDAQSAIDEIAGRFVPLSDISGSLTPDTNITLSSAKVQIIGRLHVYEINFSTTGDIAADTPILSGFTFKPDLNTACFAIYKNSSSDHYTACFSQAGSSSNLITKDAIPNASTIRAFISVMGLDYV